MSYDEINIESVEEVMTEAAQKHAVLEQKLIAGRRDGTLSDQDDYAILEEMGDLWWLMTDEECDEVDARVDSYLKDTASKYAVWRLRLLSGLENDTISDLEDDAIIEELDSLWWKMTDEEQNKASLRAAERALKKTSRK